MKGTCYIRMGYQTRKASSTTTIGWVGLLNEGLCQFWACRLCWKRRGTRWGMEQATLLEHEHPVVSALPLPFAASNELLSSEFSAGVYVLPPFSISRAFKV